MTAVSTPSPDAAHDCAQRVAAALLDREGTGTAWRIEIEDAREGYARIAMRVVPEMLNGFGMAHGG